jgi:hypothetical protein
VALIEGVAGGREHGSGGSRGAAELSELRLAATTTEPLSVAAEAQQAAAVAELQQPATVDGENPST